MKEIKYRMATRFVRCMINLAIWTNDKKLIDIIRRSLDKHLGQYSGDRITRSVYRDLPRYMQKTLSEVWSFLWMTDNA